MKKFKFLKKKQDETLNVNDLQGYVPVCGSTISNVGVTTNILGALEELRTNIERLEDIVYQNRNNDTEI